MKCSGIEKGVLIVIALCILILCFTIPRCMSDLQQIEKKGVKSSFDKLWYGEDIPSKNR